MKRPNLALIICLLIPIFIVFYSNHSKEGRADKAIKENRAVIVIIDDNGFSPDKIAISLGTIVTFINKGAKPHWPASNPHPVHTAYPEGGGCLGSQFDACRGLKTDEEYSFTFNDLGSWGAHDHLFPGFVLVVNVVEDPNSFKEESFNSKDTLPVDDFRKLNYGKQTEIIKSMANIDPARSWDYLKRSFIVNGQVIRNVHEFAHIIGNRAYDKFGINGIKVCDSAFAYGCFHGVTERMLLKNGIGSIKIIEGSCLKLFPPDDTNSSASCIHGIGHGVYGFEEGNMKKALLDCDVVSEEYRQYCYDGAFMENSSSQNNISFDAKNPWKFCASFEEKYQRSCATYQVPVFLGASSLVENAGKICVLGPSDTVKEACFESLGYKIAGGSLGNSNDILTGCNKMPSAEGRDICIVAGATEITFQKYNNFKISSSELCKSLAEPKQAQCLVNIHRLVIQ